MANYEQYYENSIEALKKYIVENKIMPTEKVWNGIAVKQNYLTSQSIGYLSGMKFPEICKKIYNESQKNKKEI